MSLEDKQSTSRRKFLQTGLSLPLALTGAGALANDPAEPKAARVKTDETTDAPGDAPGAASPSPDQNNPLPMRKLGATGIEVTMLNTGGMMGWHGPQYLDICWSLGIRYFDTADCYKGGNSERDIGEWLQKYPERRKDLFLVTKDHPRGGFRELLTQIDARLENMKTDYVDLFFIHGIGPGEYGEESLDWPKSQEMNQVFEQLKKSGKCRLVGFSCHDGRKADYLKAAAEGGFVDAIMVAYNPFLNPSDDLLRAMDDCHKAGIGLISMKEMKALHDLPRMIPEFEKMGLTAPQALLQAVWSDERVASICSAMENIQQLQENCEAARKYNGPLSTAMLDTMREYVMAAGPTMCPNCDGRCKAACGAEAALDDIARYVTYYEKDGLVDARDYYRALSPAQRSFAGADLKAAREACLCGLDFEKITAKAEKYFA